MTYSRALVFDYVHERWLSFSSPKEVLTSNNLNEIIQILTDAEQAANNRGLWAVGWVSYEAAPACDPAFEVNSGSSVPLIWFGLYDSPTICDRLPRPTEITSSSWLPRMSETEYSDAFVATHKHIAQGDTYQVNLSFRMRVEFLDNPYALFYSMVEKQAGRYSFFLDTGRFVACSASPELFFEKEHDQIICRPMKGTAKRSVDQERDQINAQHLATSDKERAENVMIVDMVRNDLSRIADDASVTVTDLFLVEHYPGVLQMVSEVRAKTQASIAEVMRALFPSASITGAPKCRTMQLIKRYENSPRGLYTGSIGVMNPQGRSWFNVAIRTAMVDRTIGSADYGVGSGVVWDSVRANEYSECLLKAGAVLATSTQVSLFETLRWEATRGFWLLHHHLDRLIASARHFGYPCDLSAVTRALEEVVQSASTREEQLRVRIALDPCGVITSHVSPCPITTSSYRVALARNNIQSSDARLFHKTTDRSIYNDAAPVVADVDDVLLWNERKEVTESRIANIVVTLRGSRYTPPTSSGLLPGCLRRDLLLRGEISERIITLDDLAQAEEVYLINSVRGMWRVEVVQP